MGYLFIYVNVKGMVSAGEKIKPKKEPNKTQSAQYMEHSRRPEITKCDVHT